MPEPIKKCLNCRYWIACSLLQYEGFDWEWCCDNWQELLDPNQPRWEPMPLKELMLFLPGISLN